MVVYSVESRVYEYYRGVCIEQSIIIKENLKRN